MFMGVTQQKSRCLLTHLSSNFLNKNIMHQALCGDIFTFLDSFFDVLLSGLHIKPWLVLKQIRNQVHESCHFT